MQKFKFLATNLKNSLKSPFLQTQLSKNPFSATPVISQFSLNSFHSWRSQHCISQRGSVFFMSRRFFRDITSNTHKLIRRENNFLGGILSRVGLFRTIHGRSSFTRPFDSVRGSWRSFFPDSDGVVLSLIGANVVVFILWRIADPAFMNDNFVISVENIKSGRLHTVVTSAFSHISLGHLGSNMIGLYFFGSAIENLFGPKFLLKLYLAGAISGSIFFLAHKVFNILPFEDMQNWRPGKTYGLGASGAVNAIILLDIFLFPKAVHYINFFIPVPAVLLGALLIGKDLLRVSQGDPHISGEAHLGGALVAALIWARLKKGWI